MSHLPDTSGVRRQVIQGGIYLTLRRLFGMVLGVFGILLITRLIGPAAYGLFASASGVFYYLQYVGLMSLDVYLIRSPGEAGASRFHLAFWWLLGVGIVGAVLVSLGILAVGHFWVRTEGFVPVALALCLGLPVALAGSVPRSLLEREFRYAAIAKIDMLSQLGYYLTGITLAWRGLGVWALVGAFWMGQILAVVGALLASRYQPRWYWNREEFVAMLRYGVETTIPGWLYTLRFLGPSLVLLPLAGKEAVGYFSLCVRFLDMLSFVRESLGRVAIPAFARIRGDAERLTRAVNEAMTLSLPTLGVFFVGFLWAAPVVLPSLLGTRWDVAVLAPAFAGLAIRYLLSSFYSLQATALQVIGKTRVLILTHALYIPLYFALTALGTALAPVEWKLLAFVAGELVAHTIVYVGSHWGFRRYVGRPNYLVAYLWTLGFSSWLLAPLIGWGWVGVGGLFFVHPASLRALRRALAQLKSLQNAPVRSDSAGST